MATALAIRPPEIPPPSVAFGDFVAAIADADAPIRQVTRDAEAALLRGEESLGDALDVLRSDFETARAYVSQGGDPGGQLDDVIAAAERTEDAIRRDDARIRKLIGRIRALARLARPDLAAAIGPLADGYEQASARFVSEFQRIRWQYMALRAESRRDETGPAFSDPRELRRYLDSLA